MTRIVIPTSSIEDANYQPKYCRRSPWTLAIILTALTATLSSFSYGINISIINTPEVLFKSCNVNGGGLSGLQNVTIQQNGSLPLLPVCVPVTNAQWSLIVSIFCLGGLVGKCVHPLPGSICLGALFTGRICNTFGRKWVFLANNIIFCIGYCCMSLAPSYLGLVFGRVILGLASGATTVLVPLYMGEVGPIEIRGALGTLHQLGIVLGILFSQAVSIPLSTNSYWRYLFAIGVIPILIQSILIFLLNESPYYLVTKGCKDEAYKCLSKLRATSSSVDAEMHELLENHRLHAESQEGSITIWQLLNMKMARKSLYLGILYHVVQQFSGVNAVFYFSTSMFQDADTLAYASIITMCVGLLNVISTLLSLWFMEKAGRKTLVLWSISCMIFTGVLLTFAMCYNVLGLRIAGVLGYVFSFAFGLGPIPWLITSEIFPSCSVGAAGSILVSINWIANFIVGITFNSLVVLLNSYFFLPYCVILTAGLIIISSFMIETRCRKRDYL